MVIQRTGSLGIYYGSERGTSDSLNQIQRETNATYIKNYFISKGWTLNSICGMLGNMQAESSINPGRWESDIPYSYSNGFGLVQWTPSTKYINWVESTYGSIADYTEIDYNMIRIIYELDNNLQWIATSQYNYSFSDFTIKTDSPEELASAWLKNYERAGIEVEEYRRTLAREWWDYFGGEPPVPPIIRKKFPWAVFLRKIRNQRIY